MIQFIKIVDPNKVSISYTIIKFSYIIIKNFFPDQEPLKSYPV